MSLQERIWKERGLRDAVLAGNQRAWQTLYDESFDQLYAYAHWRCAGLADWTEEVVQETWLTAVRRIGSFDPERGSFADWLKGIAANVVRNHSRARRRRQARAGPLGREPGSDCRPEADLEAAERARRIAQALAELPARYEAALRAKYLERQSVAQIAAAWQQTPKAVESVLARARQAFREAFTRLEQNDGTG